MTRAEMRAEADALLVARGFLPADQAGRIAEIERRDGTIARVLTFERPRKRKAHKAPTQDRAAEREAVRLKREHEVTLAKRTLAKAGLLSWTD